MNRVLFFLISLFILVPSALAFDVYDSNDVKRHYFSLTNDDFVVKSSSDATDLELKFEDGNSTIEKTLSFSACGDLFCAGTSLVDFASNNSLSLDSMEFRLVFNDEVQLIYLDIDEPQFNIVSSFVDNTTDELKVQFNYSDNYDLKNIAVFERSGSSETFIENITTNSYVQSVSEVGSVNLVFKVFDVAGNSISKEESFFVDDIFEPEILETFVTLNDDGKYDFFFKIADSSLSNYELNQGSLKVTGTASGSSYESTITIPYSSGSFTFKIYDSKDNFATKTVSLSSPFDVSFNKKISNEKEFEFKTSAEKCVLTGIDSENYNEEFDKSSNVFSLDLDIDDVKEYDVGFYCENNNIKQHFVEQFYYDTNKPQVPEIELEATDRGYILIEWDEVEDEESDDIDYELFRDDDDKIYSGSKEEYTDKKVSYPNEYEYYLIATDEAGNEVRSAKRSITPIKTNIRLEVGLESGLTVESDTKKFSVETDIGSDLEIIVRNANVLVHQDSIKDIKQTEFDVSVPLKEGINQIDLKATDSQGNVVEDTVFLTYSKPYVEPQPQPVVVVEEAKIEEAQPQVEEEPEVIPIEETSYQLWWIFWILIFVIFIWYFVFNENRLKERMAHHLQANRKSKDKTVDDIIKKRARDKALALQLKKVQKVRQDKHFDRVREARKTEERKKKPLSALQQQKMKEIEKKKQDQIFTPKENTHSRRGSQKEERPGFFATLFSGFGGKDEKDNEERPKRRTHEAKEDHMSHYIHKQKQAKSWDDPKLYRQKYHDDLAAEKLREQRELEALKLKEAAENKAQKEKEDKEFRKKQQAEMIERNRRHGIEGRNDLGLEDYLSKRTKKKRFLFAERAVDDDIKSRRK